MTTLLIIASVLAGGALLTALAGPAHFATANGVALGATAPRPGARSGDPRGAIEPSWTAFMRGL
jgi:hypothetical protein